MGHILDHKTSLNKYKNSKFLDNSKSWNETRNQKHEKLCKHTKTWKNLILNEPVGY